MYLMKSRGIVKGLFTLQCIFTLSLISLLFISCVSAGGDSGTDKVDVQTIDDDRIPESGDPREVKSLFDTCGVICIVGIFLIILLYTGTWIFSDNEVEKSKPLSRGELPIERRNLLPSKTVCRRCKGKLVYSRDHGQLYCWKCKEYISVKVFYPGKRVLVRGSYN